MSPTPQELNVRLQAVEKVAGESLLEIQHRQGAQAEAIQGLRQDMHRLVELNERQLVLQQQQAESSKALDRAFSGLKELRSDTNELVRGMDQAWARWREKHENENADTTRFATSARGGLRVLGLLGVVLWGVLGGVALDWRADLLDRQAEEKRIRADADAAMAVRIDAVSGQLQEIRIKNELESNPPRSATP